MLDESSSIHFLRICQIRDRDQEMLVDDGEGTSRVSAGQERVDASRRRQRWKNDAVRRKTMESVVAVAMRRKG